MRRLKTIFVALLAATIVLGAVPCATAADPFPDVAGTKYEDAVNTLANLSKDGQAVFKGDLQGAFRPAEDITRAEVTAVLTRSFGLENMAQLLMGATEFSDVPSAHWASGYINLASSKGWIHGVGGGLFAPNAPVTYQQFVAMLVRALGYEDEAIAAGGWPTGYEMAAFSLGLTEGTDYDGGANASRGDVALMAYAALFDVPVAGTDATLAESVFGLGAAALALNISADASVVPVNTVVEFTAEVVDGNGSVLEDDAVVWAADFGLIGQNGRFISNEPGTATVTATSGDLTATAEVVVYGAAYGLALSGPSEVVANGSSEYEVIVQVVDELGNPVSKEVEIRLEHDTDNGAVTILDDYGVTDENGQLTLTVRSSTLPDRTDTLVAYDDDEDYDLVEGFLDVYSEVQVPTDVEVEIDDEKLAVNVHNSTFIDAWVVDQVGEAMLQGVYGLTFNMVGAGVWGSTGDQSDLERWLVGDDVINEEVSGIMGETGSIALTVSSEGLEPGTATVQCLIAGDPYRLVVKAENTEGIVADEYATEDDVKVTVTATDRRGVPVSVGEYVYLDLSFDTENLEYIDTTADPLVIEPGDSACEFYLVGTTAGDWLFEISDKDEALVGGGSFIVNIMPNHPYDIAVTPEHDLDITGATPVSIEAFIVDRYGNPIPTAGTDMTFAVDADGANQGEGFVNGEQEVTVKTGADGVATATFTAQHYADDQYAVWVESPETDDAVTGSLTVVEFIATDITLETTDSYEGDAKVSSVTASPYQAVYVHATLKDANGVPILGRQLTFDVVAGGGFFTDSTGETDEDGIAVGEFIPGLSGVSVLEVTFNGQVNPVAKTTSVRTYVGQPYKLVAYNGDGETGEGAEVEFTTAGVYGPYTVKVEDFGGNEVPALEEIVYDDCGIYGCDLDAVRTIVDGVDQWHIVIPKGESRVTFWVVFEGPGTYSPGEVPLAETVHDE